MFRRKHRKVYDIRREKDFIYKVNVLTVKD